LLLGLAGCGLFGTQVTVSKPPTNEADAREWWQYTLDNADQATLRCWLRASEYHRLHGSSATYVSHEFLGHNMLGPCYHDSHMPTPIPVEFLPAAQARVTGEKLDELQSARAERMTVVEKCKGCDKQQAWDAWRRRQD
jgi:hypothetical protein